MSTGNKWGSGVITYGDYLRNEGVNAMDKYNQFLVDEINHNLSYANNIKIDNGRTIGALPTSPYVTLPLSYGENRYVSVSPSATGSSSITGGSGNETDTTTDTADTTTDTADTTTTPNNSNDIRYEDALKDIEVARQRAVVDAANAYEQNKATYGAKAEALASMGLTGGGYSDYIDSQAYATQRAEVQAANANAETAKREAKYAAEEREDTYKNNMFDYLFKEVNAGNYTLDELKPIMDNFGFNETQINMLTNAATNYTKREAEGLKGTQYQNYQSISAAIKENPNSYTDADIDRAVAEEAITAEDGEALKKLRADTVSKNETETEDVETSDIIEEINYMISTGNIGGALREADRRKSEGKMDDSTYKQVYYDGWKAALDVQTLTVDSIKNVLRDIRSDVDSGKLSNEQLTELQKYAWGKLGKAYTKEQANVSEPQHFPSPISNTVLYVDGVKYQKNQYQQTDDDTKNILNAIATGDMTKAPEEGTLVEYDGKTYVYIENFNPKTFLGITLPTYSINGNTEVSWIEIEKVPS